MVSDIKKVVFRLKWQGYSPAEISIALGISKERVIRELEEWA